MSNFQDSQSNTCITIDNCLIFTAESLDHQVAVLGPPSIQGYLTKDLVDTLNQVGFSTNSTTSDEISSTQKHPITSDLLAKKLFDLVSRSIHDFDVTPRDKITLKVITDQSASLAFNKPCLILNNSSHCLHIVSDSSVLLHTLDANDQEEKFFLDRLTIYDKQIVIPPKTLVAAIGNTSVQLIEDYDDFSLLPSDVQISSLLNFLLQNQISENIFEEKLTSDHKNHERSFFTSSLETLESFYPSDNTNNQQPHTSFPCLERNLAGILKNLNLSADLLQFPNLQNTANEYDALNLILDASGIPYRESSPPEYVCDCQDYLFSEDSISVAYYKRHKRGYEVHAGDQVSYLSDGESHPTGNLLYLYPTLEPKSNSLGLLSIAFKRTSWSLLMIFGTATLLGAATVLPSIIVNQLISTYIPYGDYYSLVTFGVLAVSVLTCIFIVQIIQTRYLVRFEILCDSALQTLMIDRLLKIDPSHINTFTQGSLQSRVLGLAQLRSIVSSNLTPILTALTSVLFNFIYLFYYSWQLALIVLTSGLVLAISTIYGAIIRTKYFKLMTEIDGNLVSLTNDIIAGITDVRASDTFGDLYHRFTKVTSPLVNAVFNATRMADRVTVLSNSSLYITYIFLLPAAYYLYQSGDTALTIGAIISFLTCAQIFLSNFQVGINLFIIAWVTTSTYWDRALDVVQLPIEGQSIPRPAKQLSPNGKLNINKLSSPHAILGDSLYFKNVSFDVPYGSSHLLLGPEGCGKSTLMQFLCNVDSDYIGTISAGGVDIKTVEPRAYRSNIAFVPQAQYFQQGTIFSNIASSQSITKQELSLVLNGLDLSDYLTSLPMKLGTVITPKAEFLPYDIRRKLLLAKACIKRCDFIFIDNGLDGLDNDVVSSIMNFLKSQNKTILVTSSNKKLIPLFDNYTQISELIQ